ncbi:MAG TPA: hypothetical protein VEK38_00805 [Candidatus Bathyarchaeia archaeon]|nr:hypothetical protein [Candidatus Bathyarchaeia archaeon]
MIKNNTIPFFIVLGIVGYSHAALDYYTEKTKTATPGKNFTFEIKNKGPQPFYLTVFSGDGRYFTQQIFVPQATNLQPGYVRVAGPSTFHSLTVILQFLDKTLTKNIATYTYDIHSQGTPVFVSWDGKKLVPQTGSYWGYSGYTESGIPMNNNIEAQDIELIEIKQ